MFTGIIQAVGTVKKIESRGGDRRIYITASELPWSDVELGDSIAANGVCLTAVELSMDGYCADVSTETLDLTTVKNWQVGTMVNLEKALTPTSRLGGHIVSGHVDGLGRVIERKKDARSERFTLEAPDSLAKYIAHKGSITVDGTSLTVNEVNGALFELNIVPHTLENTIINDYESGTLVNLEVDVIARYLERLIMGENAAVPEGANAEKSAPSVITESFLADNGFLK